MKKMRDAPVYIGEGITFEIDGTFRKIFNVFFIPFLDHLPIASISYLVKTHKSANVLVENKTNHYALEILYQKGKTFSSRYFISSLFRKMWFHTNNARAVRNRLKIVKAELQRDIKYRIDNGDKYIKILNIASGSARAVLETIHSFSNYKDVTFDVIFLDKNPVAVEYSKDLAKGFDLRMHKLEWITATVGEYFNEHDKADGEPFDIVEMVGLMDYFTDAKAESIFARIHQRLSDGAFFITANIVDNKERRFVTKVIGWEMIYRNASDMKKILVRSGFRKENIQMFYEPYHIHTLASSYK
jgi:hypothetical protein